MIGQKCYDTFHLNALNLDLWCLYIHSLWISVIHVQSSEALSVWESTIFSCACGVNLKDLGAIGPYQATTTLLHSYNLL